MTLIQTQFTLNNPQFIIPGNPVIYHARLGAQRYGSERKCRYNLHTSRDYNIVTYKTSEHTHNQAHWQKIQLGELNTVLS
jgi:hypothetical protein